MSPAQFGFPLLLASLDRLEIRHSVGGSVASSVRGNYRLTNDVDIVVRLSEDQIQPFVDDLGPDFYADADSIRDAFALKGPFDVIHMPSAFKFDLFPANGIPFAESQIERGTFEEFDFFGTPLEFSVISVEDIILAKLNWFRLYNETSEQQWKDVTALLAIHGPNLDRQYLKSWSEELQITHLLSRLSLLP